MTATATYPPAGMTGRRQLHLMRAFDRVRDLRDWKGPIQAVIPAVEKRLVQKAVIVFTGTWPRFAEIPGEPDLLVVTSPGFRVGRSGE